jgi:oligopeptide/dipeptide ABC transporter ATP-binding protein
MIAGPVASVVFIQAIKENVSAVNEKALLSAIPTTDEVQPKRIILKGDIPSNIFPPSGCKFRTRCPIATEKCAREVPAYEEVKKGHFVACHYYEKTKDIK